MRLHVAVISIAWSLRFLVERQNQSADRMAVLHWSASDGVGTRVPISSDGMRKDARVLIIFMGTCGTCAVPSGVEADKDVLALYHDVVWVGERPDGSFGKGIGDPTGELHEAVRAFPSPRLYEADGSGTILRAQVKIRADVSEVWDP